MLIVRRAYQALSLSLFVAFGAVADSSAPGLVFATGSTSPRSFEDRASDVVNIKDYGAVCDGRPHPLSASYSSLESAKAKFPSATSLANEIDGLASQSALYALKKRTFGGSPVTGRLVLPGGFCRFNTTWDLADLDSYSVLIDGAGTIIWGLTKGNPVINAFGMRHVTFRDVAIWGDPAATPTIGIQVGLSGNGYPADSNRFDSVRLYGSFSFADFYNFSSEVTSFDHVYFSNDFAGTACYTFVEDGQNHWGLSKKMAADAAVSFNENHIDNSWISASHGCTPLWIGGSARHKWTTSYIANFSGGGYGAILWSGGLGNWLLDFDVHVETSPTDTFFLTGPTKNITLVGFKYRDHFNQATNSIFKLDSDILSAKLQGGSIEIGGFYHHPKLVDNPRLWRADLDVYLPTRAAWNLTEGFFGRLTIGDNPVTFTPSVRQNLTAAGLMVPEDISLVRFTQRTAIPSASVSLPKPVADGQPIQFVNYDGAVKSFTFLPPVHGWVNGSAFAANSGVRIRWDANEAAWYREE